MSATMFERASADIGWWVSKCRRASCVGSEYCCDIRGNMIVNRSFWVCGIGMSENPRQDPGILGPLNDSNR